jgi:hypothetical protein
VRRRIFRLQKPMLADPRVGRFYERRDVIRKHITIFQVADEIRPSRRAATATVEISSVAT